MYLTDDVTVAEGYARTKRVQKGETPAPAVLRVSVPADAKLVDLEKPLPPDAMAALQRTDFDEVKGALEATPATGRAFYEALKADGNPDPTLKLRVRVQARQIFAYCRAQKMGWTPDVETMVRGMAEFIGHYGVTQCRSDGYAHLLNPDFSIADVKKDLYDHAFFTLAFAAIYDTFKDKTAHFK